MHVDALEKKWVYVAILMAAVLVGVMTAYAVGSNIHPPSNVETIDSTRLHLTSEFAEDQLGVKRDGNGITVTMVAARYGFFPQRIEVPANTPVRFRIASADVLHGVHAPYTNMSTMVVPGYVSEVNTQFPRAGEYPLLCNEYCGFGHDYMWSRLIVTPSGS
ncbi:MAG: hypothetical protein KDG50_10955 [Chromatiales bacterium]|nr:hypothetical protein [Chromatiales bacterium]